MIISSQKQSIDRLRQTDSHGLICSKRAPAGDRTLPDAEISRTVIHHCRFLAPAAAIIARARYHVVRWELQMAGALHVVDEELGVGRSLAKEVRRHLMKHGG